MRRRTASSSWPCSTSGTPQALASWRLRMLVHTVEPIWPVEGRRGQVETRIVLVAARRPQAGPLPGRRQGELGPEAGLGPFHGWLKRGVSGSWRVAKRVRVRRREAGRAGRVDLPAEVREPPVAHAEVLKALNPKRRIGLGPWSWSAFPPSLDPCEAPAMDAEREKTPRRERSPGRGLDVLRLVLLQLLLRRALRAERDLAQAVPLGRRADQRGRRPRVGARRRAAPSACWSRPCASAGSMPKASTSPSTRSVRLTRASATRCVSARSWSRSAAAMT